MGILPHHVEKKKSLSFKYKFCFVQHAVCRRVMSPKLYELKDFPPSREPHRHLLPMSPSDSGSFCSPFYALFHCRESRSSNVFPTPGAISRGRGTAVTNPDPCHLLHKSRKIILFCSKTFHSPPSQWRPFH